MPSIPAWRIRQPPWSPRCAAVDHLGLVQPGDGSGQRVVVAVALAARRRLHAGLGQPFAVLDVEVLGEFNPSSQHFLIGGVFEPEEIEV